MQLKQKCFPRRTNQPRVQARTRNSMKMKIFCIAFFLCFALSLAATFDHTKRSFSDLGCMGVYDRAKFARLDRVCEECYQLFKESDVHTSCRSNCFKNNFFTQCVDALLLQKDQQRLDNMVEQLYGR